MARLLGRANTIVLYFLVFLRGHLIYFFHFFSLTVNLGSISELKNWNYDLNFLFLMKGQRFWGLNMYFYSLCEMS